jgi:hypothetical protein
MLEVMFCVGVQHRLQFYLDHLNCAKMMAFQFYLQSGKQRKIGCVGDHSHVVFGQNFPSEKVNVRWCVASSFAAKVLGEVFAQFHTVAVKCHSSMQN